jgi:hypothetical protein
MTSSADWIRDKLNEPAGKQELLRRIPAEFHVKEQVVTAYGATAL